MRCRQIAHTGKLHTGKGNWGGGTVGDEGGVQEGRKVEHVCGCHKDGSAMHKHCPTLRGLQLNESALLLVPPCVD